jgi:hypothetical protein
VSEDDVSHLSLLDELVGLLLIFMSLLDLMLHSPYSLFLNLGDHLFPHHSFEK